MFIAIGCDENLRFNDDYELILDYIKDTETCIKSLNMQRALKRKRYLDAYILLKDIIHYSKDLRGYEKTITCRRKLLEKEIK